MQYVIDRIEGSVAVCEDPTGKMVSIPADKIAGEYREGDTLISADGVYIAHPTQNDNRALFERLFKKKK